MNENLEIYVVTCFWDSYDDKFASTEYVGLEKEEAIRIAENFKFSDATNAWVYVDLWINGKHVKAVHIIDV